MDIFGFDESMRRAQKSGFTIEEIFQQPSTWEKTFAQAEQLYDTVQDFIKQTVAAEDFDIVLTGAGTSEFVGNTIFHHLSAQYGYRVRAVATTDIVPAPESFLSRQRPTLLISFGRSGDSPESIGAVQAADAVCQKLQHLFVSCNPDGQLAKMAEGRENCYSVHLTPETHDRSFAMTSSYSNMYLITLLLMQKQRPEKFRMQLSQAVSGARSWLSKDYAIADEIVKAFDFSRIVYLGNTALKGVAQESALKMLELSAGRVATMHDSPLGFRHGPKSIIDDRTLTVLYLSDDEYLRGYELDLLREMSGQRKHNKLVVVHHTACAALDGLCDYTISIGDGMPVDNVWLGLCAVLFAQTLATLKSLSLGITPDNPCPTGEVNRVVKGVTLYPYQVK